jgi:hypothetical protein
MIEFECKSADKSPERRTSAATFGTPVLLREISRKWMQMRVRQAIGAGAPIEFKAHHADPSLLLWYAAAVVAGCLGWLLYLVFGTLN